MGRTVNLCNQVADEIKKDNISCSVLDLRTLSPLDEDSILEAVEETGRVVIVDESSPRCNVATDISALISDKAFFDKILIPCFFAFLSFSCFFLPRISAGLTFFSRSPPFSNNVLTASVG